ncbi:MAG: endonuclease III domain-containing protein [Gemmatimonadota bacterium]
MPAESPARERTGDGGHGEDASRIREIEGRLRQRYGEPEKRRRPPLDELLLTILSQNTSDTNRDRAWRELRSRFGSWREVLEAERGELEDAIRVAGLAGQKGEAIHGVLATLDDERDALSLDHLDDLDDGEAMRYLESFRGVGTKTAACVLCFSLHRPVLPVDTHVRRVCERLGLIPEGTGAVEAHSILQRTVPAELRFPLHLLLIRHGRATCGARRPACGECVLEDLCARVGVDGRR